jgi:hypothetical protein
LKACDGHLRRLTGDPAGVSGKIKPPDGMTRMRSAKRLQLSRGRPDEAVASAPHVRRGSRWSAAVRVWR